MNRIGVVKDALPGTVRSAVTLRQSSVRSGAFELLSKMVERDLP